MTIEIPYVTLYGYMEDVTGQPYDGELFLIPEVPAVELNDQLFTTIEYEFVAEEGMFAVSAMATNVGVSTPWMYEFWTPGKNYRISLPYGGPHNFAELLAESDRETS